jgi:SSS family transporter
MLLGAVILYFFTTILIGYFANRKIRNTGDFINTGRNLHPAVNAAALFALWFGSETIFGASSEFASSGLLGVIEDPFGGVLCLLLVGLVYSRRLYRMNVYTIGDIFEKSYGQKTEFFSSILMIVSFFGYAGAQMVALGLIVQVLTGLSLSLSIVLSALVVIAYTFSGGMWAVSLTDFVQSILIVTGLVVIVWIISDMTGGPMQVIRSIPEEHLQFFPDAGIVSWINWVAAWMVLGVGSIVSQDVFQRVNSARSEDAAYYSTLAGAGLYFVLALLPLYLIAAIRILDPGILEGDLQLALPVLVLNTMPQWVQILFFGSLLSAIMSTCSGALLAPASLLSENILKHRFFKTLDDKHSLRLTRVSVLVMGVISLLMAFGSQNIFHLVGEASIFGLVSIFIPFTAALFFEHRSVAGAWTSMIAGSVVWFFSNYIYITDIEALVPGTAASGIGLWAGTVWDRKFRNG